MVDGIVNLNNMKPVSQKEASIVNNPLA